MKLKIESLKKKIKQSNYDLFYYLFYKHSPGWTAELILSIIEITQILSFTFGEQVLYLFIILIFSLHIFGKQILFLIFFQIF